MELSFITVNHYSSGVLPVCLDSIYKTLPEGRFEIIVVDNSSDDPGMRELTQRYPDLSVLSNPENRGFAKANNQGAAAAKGRWLVFLNPDTELTENAIAGMQAHLEAHPKVGVIAPKVLNLDGSLQYSCRRFPTLWTGLFNRYSMLSRLFPSNRFTRRYLMTDFDHNAVREVDWVSGCFMMMRRDAFERIGGFDESYFLFNEDVDLCRAMQSRGYSVVYFPQATVYHEIGSSYRRVPPRLIIERHRGMKHYFKKHHAAAGRVTRGLVDSFIDVRCLSQLFFNLFR